MQQILQWKNKFLKNERMTFKKKNDDVSGEKMLKMQGKK